jgi:hypothetical protein
MNSDSSSSYEIPPAAFSRKKPCHSTQSILDKGIQWIDSEERKRRRLYHVVAKDTSLEYNVLMAKAKKIIEPVDQATKKRIIHSGRPDERKQKKKKFCATKSLSLCCLQVDDEVG